MALYYKWDVKNDFAYVLQFFSLISDRLGSVLSSSFTREILILILHQLANGYSTPSLSLLSGVNNIFIMAPKKPTEKCLNIFLHKAVQYSILPAF